MTEGLRETSERLDRVLRQLDAHESPGVRALLHEAVQALMTLHGTALQQLLALASDPALGGNALVARIADDALIGPLLLAHRLHPYAVDARLARALDRLRPVIAAQGCRATLAGLEDGVARVHLAGAARLADGASLRAMLETTLLEAAPELEEIAIDVTETAPPPAPPLIRIARGPAEALSPPHAAP